MGLPIPLFRPLLSLVLGAVFFLAFFAYLLFNIVDGHFLSANFYAAALAEQNVYARLYDEVLVDPALEDESKELLGNLDVPQDEVAGLARNIMPPEYLQRETERSLRGLIGYLKKDADELELHIDLTGPLHNASGELVKYAQDRIDRIEVVEAGETAETDLAQDDDGQSDPKASEADATEIAVGEATQQATEALQGEPIRLEQVKLETDEEWTAYWENTVHELQSGELPSRVPKLEGVDIETRLESYDEALDELRQTDDVPAEVLDALDEPETDARIREALQRDASDLAAEEEIIQDVLKAATSGVVPALVDDTLDDVRRNLTTPDGMACEHLPQDADLSQCTQYDLLSLVDEDIEEGGGLAEVRDGIQLYGTLGRWLPWVVMLAACVLVALVNLPRIVSILRWLGLILAFTGLFFLIAGMMVGGTVPDRLDSPLQEALADADAPESMQQIASDVTHHMADSLSLALTSPSLITLVVGGILIVTSLFIRRIPVPAEDTLYKHGGWVIGGRYRLSRAASIRVVL